MFVVLTSMVLAAPVSPEADQSHRDLTRLQGSWKLVSCRLMGGELVEHGKLHGEEVVIIKIDGKTATWCRNDRTEGETVKLDASVSPRAIDFGERKQVNRAIYRFDGEQLNLCFHFVLGPRGAIGNPPRPKSFEDEYRVVMVFGREER